MIHVNIDDLKAGMILTRPVYNHQEVLLLDAGARVTKKNIRIFKSWGVTRVYVKGNLTASKGAVELPEAGVSESIQMKLKEKFSDVLDDPVMVEIFNAASIQLAKKSPNNENENEPS